ncbi:site-2 protease family protein [Bacillus kexueae]|uniref:site-2 protease family protein n=1 Tax=Aeribacillus kexueae TaxID=2078952 RepID=UPI001FB03F24|nr:site-2 protease family protein [Bacillus kexueae]
MGGLPLPFLHYDLSVIPHVIVSLVIAFTVHEFAHAYVAYKFGDETAKNQGRLTLNPLSHLDPFGTILIFIAGFGWAKPVPVNRFFFKKPRLAGISVSLAGPISNLLLAFVGYLFFNLWMLYGGATLTEIGATIQQFFRIFVSLNIVLFLFNLLPFPPLDGYRIIEDLAPTHIRPKLTQFESYGVLIFLIIVFTPLDRYIIYPIFTVGQETTLTLFRIILQPFFT